MNRDFPRCRPGDGRILAEGLPAGRRRLGVLLAALPVVLLPAVLLSAMVGCGGRSYEKRLAARVVDLRKNSPFNQLQPPEKLPGTRVEVRVPKFFTSPPLVAGQERNGVTIDERRVKPPIVDLLELRRAYEAFFPAEDGANLPCLVSLAAIEVGASGRDPTYAIAASLRERYPDGATDWQTVDCPTPEGGMVPWQRLRVTGTQFFYSMDENGAGFYRPVRNGVMEIYTRADVGWRVLIAWRIPGEIEQQVGMAELAKLVAGSVRFDAPGERAPSTPPPAPPGPGPDGPAPGAPVRQPETAPSGEPGEPVAEPAPGDPFAEPAPGTTAETVPPQGAEPEPAGLPADSPESIDTSLGNLEQIADAMLKYAQKHGRLPAAAAHSPDGKPLLSWRVAILPLLGHEDLHGQFRLDEPWDSEHNRKLAERMPDVFRTPSGPGRPKTCYLVPVGPGTVFAGTEGMAMDWIRDGVDATVLVVEADPDRAVVWTEPRDWEYVPAQPAFGLGKLRGDWFMAVTADAIPHRLKTGANVEVLRGAMTAAGRERIDLSSIALAEPVRPATPPGTPPADEPASGTLLDQARAALAEGAEDRAVALLMADAVVRADGAVLDTLRWSAGLKQPMLAARWGVAIETVVPPRTPAIGRDDFSTRDGAPNMEEAVKGWREKVVDPVVQQLQERVGQGTFGAWLRESKAARPVGFDPTETSPGIVQIRTTDAATIQSLAAKEGVDLLLVAVTDARTTRTGPVATLEMRLMDASGKRLWTSRELNSVQIAAAQQRPGGGDPLADFVGQVMQTVDRFHLTELPSINREAALRRAESLAASPHPNPLPALVELRYYQRSGLLSDEELAGFYGRMVGEGDGGKLATGTPAERTAVVRQWLPKE